MEKSGQVSRSCPRDQAGDSGAEQPWSSPILYCWGSSGFTPGPSFQAAQPPSLLQVALLTGILLVFSVSAGTSLSWGIAPLSAWLSQNTGSSPWFQWAGVNPTDGKHVWQDRRETCGWDTDPTPDNWALRETPQRPRSMTLGRSLNSQSFVSTATRWGFRIYSVRSSHVNRSARFHPFDAQCVPWDIDHLLSSSTIIQSSHSGTLLMTHEKPGPYHPSVL